MSTTIESPSSLRHSAKERAGFSVRQWVSIAIGLLISGAAILFVAQKMDWVAVAAIWRKLHWATFVSMVAVYMSSYALRGLRWQLMLAPIQKVGWRTSSAIVLIGYMANNLLPFRMGEVVRGLMLTRKEKVDPVASIASIGVERILDALTLLGCLAVTVACLPASEHPSLLAGSASWIVVAFLAVAGGIVGVRLFPKLATSVVQRLVRYLPGHLASRIERLFHKVLEAIAFVEWSKAFVYVLLLSLAIWCVEGLVFWIGLWGLGLEASPLTAFFCLAVVNLTILIPSAPGYVGVFQLGAMFAFATLGLAADDATAYAILVHLCQFVPVTLGGLLVLNWMGLSLRSLPQSHQSGTDASR